MPLATALFAVRNSNDDRRVEFRKSDHTVAQLTREKIRRRFKSENRQWSGKREPRVKLLSTVDPYCKPDKKPPDRVEHTVIEIKPNQNLGVVLQNICVIGLFKFKLSNH